MLKLDLLLTFFILALSLNCRSETNDKIEIVYNKTIGLSPEGNYSVLFEAELSSELNPVFENNYPRLHNISINEKGDIYVVNRREKSIIKFSSEFSLLKTFGNYGQGPGEFPNTPSSISFVNEKICILDYSGRLSFFDYNEKFISSTHSSTMSREGHSVNEIIQNDKNNIYLKSMIFTQNKNEPIKMGWALHSSDDELKTGNKILSELKIYDPKNMESERNEPVYTIKKNGNILISQNSKKEYIINEYNPSGTLVRKIHKQYIMKKRDSEYVKEINRLNISKASSHQALKKVINLRNFLNIKL